MTAADIRQAILSIFTEIIPDEDLGRLRDEVPFREQLAMDSMDFLDVVMELRKRYRIQVPEEDYAQLASMATTIKYLGPRMQSIPARGA
ncbi:MAG: acyl carrier protein [Thermoguttaceae bacterium]|jgi:acyl carrier protein